jgi:nicotinate phosphoribosyltransferase
MEVEGKPLAKRGKWSGSKKVLRCQKCSTPLTVPYSHSKNKCQCGGEFTNILIPFIKNGKVLQKLIPAKKIRNFVLAQVKGLEL